MNTNYHNLLGKKVQISASQGCYNLEVAISEGITGTNVPFAKENNLYGRAVVQSSSGDLSFASGLAATGLRATSFLSDKQLSNNAIQLEQAVRQHLALVVVGFYNAHQQLHQLSSTGAFQLWASNAQEAVDFLLIAHRISELSLIPGIVGIDASFAVAEEEVLFPESPVILGYLGNPDTQIASPTPSQEMIFGNTRRRIPNWYNPDIPVFSGVRKNVQDLGFETASKQQFFGSHLQNFIVQAFEEFGRLTGRKYEPVERLNNHHEDHTLITLGPVKKELKQAIENARKKLTGLHLNQVYPFPSTQIADYCGKTKTITVLEQCTGNIASTPVFNEIARIEPLKPVQKYSGKYGKSPKTSGLQAVIKNMFSKEEEKKKDFWLDIPMTLESSDFPKHQILLQTIERNYPESKNKSLLSNKLVIPEADKPQHKTLPINVQKFKYHGPAYSRLTRFYDDTALLYENEPNELVADPSKAVPVMPPDSAGFLNQEREMAPVFNPQNCTGCGDCFISCPHSAIPPVVLGIESLIQSGMDISKSNGHPITQLTPMVKNLSKFAHKEIHERKDEISNVGDFLPQAFENLTNQMKLEGDKLTPVTNDFNAVLEAIGNLPISITDTFYNNRELVDKGSGEIFTLAINPSSCTGCGICAEVCQPNAIQMETQTDNFWKPLEENFQLHELLPETSGDTISRLIEEAMNPPDQRIAPGEGHYNPFAALLLSRNFYESLSGGSKTEHGSSQKALLHLLLASTESAIQPKISENIKSIKELLAGLSHNIQEQLGNALPKQDFETLSEVLQETSEEKLSFNQMIDQWGAKEHLSLIDKNALQRKVTLTQALKDLLWVLQEGPNGTGRSRFGVALDGSLDWINNYPWNNFPIPVVGWDGSSVELAKGLVQGQIRHLLDNIKLLRRAKLEVKNKYDSNIHDHEIASIHWKDLTPEEKNLVPPVLLITKRSSIKENNLLALVEILDADWPVKVFVLDDAVPPTEKASSYLNNSVSTLTPAIALQKSFVLRSSLADPVHLFGGFQEGLQHEGPALFWILAPDYEKHNVSLQKWTKLNGMAWNSRAFPHFKFNPLLEGKYLSSKISLESNPEPGTWVQNELNYMENDQEQKMDYKLTIADWLYTIKGWKDHFRPYHEAMGAAILVGDYIDLEPNFQEGKVPIICRIDSDNFLKRYMVSEKVVEATEASLNAINVLREVSGELTEFPEKLQKQVEQELSRKYEEEKVALKADYEKQIKELERVHLEKVRLKLKEKLMTLSRNNG